MVSAYRLFIVFSKEGPSLNQWAYAKSYFQWVSNLMAPTWPDPKKPRVLIYVAGFTEDEEDNCGVPSLIANGRTTEGVKIHCLPCNSRPSKQVDCIWNQVRALSCDELWCLPAYNHGTLSPARTAKVHRLAKSDQHWANRVKNIPADVEVETALPGPSKPAKRKKEKEAPWPNN